MTGENIVRWFYRFLYILGFISLAIHSVTMAAAIFVLLWAHGLEIRDHIANKPNFFKKENNHV